MRSPPPSTHPPQEHILIREDDVIGVMPRAAATAADIPELRPCGDRVLVKVRRCVLCTLRCLGAGPSADTLAVCEC